MADEGKPKDDDNDDDSSAAAGSKEALQRDLARERRKRQEAERAASKLEERVNDLEAKDKSETEKLTDKASAAEKERDKLQAENLRLTVALSKGLTAKQARRLVGSTKEELEEDADDMLGDAGTKPEKGKDAGGDEDKPADDDSTGNKDEDTSAIRRPKPKSGASSEDTSAPAGDDLRTKIAALPRI